MIEYGITTSKAHVWAHVCPLDADIYFYSRKKMLALMTNYPQVEIVSAKGHLVKILPNEKQKGGIIDVIDVPWQWWREVDIEGAPNDEEAGKRAEQIFHKCVDSGLFSIPCRANFYTELQDQFTGRDFSVVPLMPQVDVEVKLDAPGGLYGTGNLFVQTHEYKHEHSARNAHKTIYQGSAV